MRKFKVVLIPIVCILTIGISFCMAYYMTDGIPSKDISTLNMICLIWGTGCSGWIIGKIGGKICIWITKK